MSTIEMETIAREYRELQAQIKALEGMADTLKQKMIKEMDARQAEEMNTGEYTIRWTVYESIRFDTTAFKETLI